MKQLDAFDPAMRCSTGVRGPNVDSMLVRFAAAVKWLQEEGIEVRRFNLSQSPAAFVENELVKAALTEKGEGALPLLLDGHVLASDTERMAGEAGLVDIQLTPKPDYANAMTDWNELLYRKIFEHLPAGNRPADYITSLEVKVRKP